MLWLLGLASSVVQLQKWVISFFSTDVPGLLVVGAIALYLAVWAAQGAMRQMSRSDQPVFSPAGAYGFLLGCLAIVTGLFWHALTG